MKLIKQIIYIIISAILVFISGLLVGLNYNSTKEFKQYNEIDTSYNVIIKDSIKYNIIIRDSIIYNLKQQMKYDIEQSKNINDSDAVKLFYKLTSGG